MKKNRTLINMGMAWLAQIVTVISGLILPRLYLQYFGSETNGLIQSITQFLNYVNLLEGGLGSVFLASLYKPLANKDNDELSKKVAAAQSYFRVIGIIFVVYTVVLAVIYPIIVKSDFDYIYVSTLILILSIGLFVQFFFSLTYKLLLQADRRVYIVLGTQIITTILNVIIISVSLVFIRSIHIVKIISTIIFLIQPIIFNLYINKNYKIDTKLKVNAKEEIPERWSCLGQNIAFFIHNNTDITLLSLIKGLKIVSVYSVHTMVVFGLKNLVMAFSQVFSPKIGISLAENNPQKIEDQIDQYEFISYFISTIFFGVCICLIVPFVMLYTSSITDVNYHKPVFAIILTYSEYIYCIRNPYIAVVYGAGKFKETAISAYLEAGINIVVSLILIWSFGLIGIVIGTSIAMTYRWIYHLFYLKNNIINRPMGKAIKRFFISIFIIGIGFAIFKLICWFEMNTVISWICGGVLCLIIFLIISLVLNYFFDKKTLLKLISRVKYR